MADADLLVLAGPPCAGKSAVGRALTDDSLASDRILVQDAFQRDAGLRDVHLSVSLNLERDTAILADYCVLAGAHPDGGAGMLDQQRALQFGADAVRRAVDR